MKTNEYYRTQFRRENVVKLLILSFFRIFASGARLLLEVFIRKDFGERYFRLSYVLFLTLVLSYVPFLLSDMHQEWTSQEAESEVAYTFQENFDQEQVPATVPQPTTTSSTKWPGWGYTLWYVYLAAFLAFGIKHHLDKKKQASVLDFAKFSLSTGELQPYMSKVPLFKEADRRNRECYLEPALFFVIGLLLAVIGQYVGWLIVFCSMFYSASYYGAYMDGDNFIMDKIDEMISNQAMMNDFVHGKNYTGSKGFVTRAQKPNTEEFRKQILPSIIKDNEPLIAQ